MSPRGRACAATSVHAHGSAAGEVEPVLCGQHGQVLRRAGDVDLAGDLDPVGAVDHDVPPIDRVGADLVDALGLVRLDDVAGRYGPPVDGVGPSLVPSPKS